MTEPTGLRGEGPVRPAQGLDLYDEAIAWYHREDKKPAS